MKPELTQEHKNSFERKFKELLKESPELEKLFIGIFWPESSGDSSIGMYFMPIIEPSGLIGKLPPRLKDRYEIIIRNLKDRAI